jgi:hypothetical protein
MMNYSERTHILKTVDRLREIVGEDDYSLSLYEKLFTEKPPCQPKRPNSF